MAQAGRYASLDGLRGFAAVSVVIFHIGHVLGEPWIAANAWLAVDLFFCLSGFVLRQAYGDRPGRRIAFREFMRVRLIRLGPLIVLGVALGASYFAFRALATKEPLDHGAFATAVFLGLLDLPYLAVPAGLGTYPSVFPLNGPQYTLFLELVANAVWRLFDRAGEWAISLGLALVCYAALFQVEFGGDVVDTFWSGFPRVGASFFLGVALYRLHRSLPAEGDWSAPFWILSAVMTTLFFLPDRPSPPVLMAWVGLGAPLLVLAGARTVLPRRLTAPALLGGELSYAIYALHFPILYWVNGVYRSGGREHDLAAETPLVLGAVLVVSWAATKYYDEPLRRWLLAATAPRSAPAAGRPPEPVAEASRP